MSRLCLINVENSLSGSLIFYMITKRKNAMNINMTHLSREAYGLLESGVGYRNEEFFGDHITDIKDVVEYQTFVLENQDIPDTILLLYDSILTKEEKDLFQSCLQDDDLTDQIHQFRDMVFSLAKKETGKEHPICKWLASKEIVAKYYNGSADTIVCYDIPDRYAILSDLGKDGILVAF